MSKKKGMPDKFQIWIDAGRRYHLSDIHIQMARELGMNPRKFGKIANEKQEPWKAPLAAFIERIYPPTQKTALFDTVNESVEGTLRSSYERSGVCFGGFRATKRMEERPASARQGSTLSILVENTLLMLNP